MRNKVELRPRALNNTMAKYTKLAGIYKLTCKNNDKVYIGKSVQINKRLCAHRNAKSTDTYISYLHRAIIKHGWDSFDVSILETVDNFVKSEDNEELLDRESYYIGLYESNDQTKGYNICIRSTDRTGIKQSEETKRKISKANKGNHKLIKANLGKTLDDDTKQRISDSLKGKKKSEEHARNISEGKKGKSTKLKGQKLSDERREQMRQVWITRRLNKQTHAQ